MGVCSGLLGSQLATTRRIPRGRADGEVRDLADALGIKLQPWQDEVLTESARMVGSRWSAFEVATIAPRQNGKSFLVVLRALAGALLYGEKLVIYSAHEYRTAQETWRLMRDICESDPVARYVRRTRMMAGGEVVEFVNGARFKLIARTRTSGRGFSPDCLLLDEAFALSGDVMSALLPSLAARPNPQVWYLSSAGTWESNVLLGIRRRGHARVAPKLAYWEWHAEATDDHRDPAIWAAANPAYGTLLTHESVSRELGALSKRAFMRERCGVWTETLAETVLREEDINAITVDPPTPPTDGSVIGWGMAAAPDRSGAVIAAATRDEAGTPTVLVVDARPGAGWLPGRLAELADKYRVDTVAYDVRGGVTDLADRATREYDVAVTPMRYEQYPTACANLAQRVAERSMRLAGAPALISDALGAGAATTGSGWVWSRKTATVPIHLEAATGALWALERNDGGAGVGVF